MVTVGNETIGIRQYYTTADLISMGIVRDGWQLSNYKRRRGFPRGFFLGSGKVYPVSEVVAWLDKQNPKTRV